MAEKQSEQTKLEQSKLEQTKLWRTRLGRTVALTGVAVAIGLAVLSMTLLALNLLPQIFPTLTSTGSLTSVALVGMTAIKTEQNSLQAVIEAARDAWMSGNASAFAELFTETGEFVIPGQVYRGTAAIQAVVAEFANTHTDVQIDIQRIIVYDDRAIVEWHWQDMEIQTGKQTVAEDAIVVDFAGTQISRWREYIDEVTPRST